MKALKSNDMNVQAMDDKIVKISNIMEQVGKLNKLIDMHRHQTKDRSMLEQYETMRSQFIKELKGLLENFEIQVSDLAAA
jgi:hypothetical protein